MIKVETIPTKVPQVEIIYDFVTPQEEQFLSRRIDEVGGDDRQVQLGNKNWGWKHLNGRRSMVWGGTILPNSHSLIPTPFPRFMDDEWPRVLERIDATRVYDDRRLERPNHCLVNEYLPGQGILPHTDGPCYEPCTSTLSLGSHTILSIRSKPTNDKEGEEVEKIEIFVPERSLLILSGELYVEYLHGIQPVSTSPTRALKQCLNWDSWWTHLERDSLSRLLAAEDDDEEDVALDNDDDEGVRDDESDRDGRTRRRQQVEDRIRRIFRHVDDDDDDSEGGDDEERTTTTRSRRQEAFSELEQGLRDLNLLSERGTGDELNHAATATVTATAADDDEVWVSNVLSRYRRKLELDHDGGGGWRRDKRVSLTCRRVKGKVRDLNGLLSTLSGKKKK